MRLRHFWYVLLVLLPQLLNGQNISVKKVIVNYVSKSILTTARITCNDFDSSFDSKQVKTKTITDSVFLKKMSHELASIKYLNSNYEIDVRWKFSIFFEDTSRPVQLCIDSFNQMIIDGRRINVKKKMSELINSFDKF